METKSLLVVRAMVVFERPFGEWGIERRNGTKHFRPGAKVYVIDAYWGMCDAVTVIGHHRASGRYAKLDMSVQHLDAFQLDRTYSQKVIALVDQHFSGARKYTDDYAYELLNAVPKWKIDR